MSNAAGISIVICTWNRADSLQNTLLSLNAQKLENGHQVEVIVVDNNSNDATKQTVSSLIGNWKLGKLRYAFEPRQGKQFALNLGLGLCTHDILAFSDDDIVFSDNWILEITRVFANKSVDLVGGKTLLSWPASGKPVWFHDSMSAVLGGVDLGEARLAPAPPAYTPAGGNMIVRRSLFTLIGGFSETHYRHMDYEFGMRSHRRKANIAYEPSLTVYAPVDKACLTKRYFRRWAFKAGITRDANGSTGEESTFLGVPRWVYRQVLQDLIFMTFNSDGKSPADHFYRDLRAWRGIGKIASTWHEILRPSKHDEWIKSYSQKKKNIY